MARRAARLENLLPFGGEGRVERAEFDGLDGEVDGRRVGRAGGRRGLGGVAAASGEGECEREDRESRELHGNGGKAGELLQEQRGKRAGIRGEDGRASPERPDEACGVFPQA